MKKYFLSDFEQSVEEKEHLTESNDFFPRTTETDPSRIADFLDSLHDASTVSVEHFEGVLSALLVYGLISREEELRIQAHSQRILEARKLEMVSQVKPNNADTKTRL